MRGSSTGYDFLRRFEGVQDILDGLIAVAVNGNLVARLVQCRYLLKQLVARDRRIAPVVLIAVIGRVIGRTEITGKALDAAIGHQLDGTHHHPVAIDSQRGRTRR